MLELLRGMSANGYSVHGFRSSFRDWAGDRTHYAREVIEHALAHQIKDKAEAAYRRSDALEKRRRLMEEWAKYCSSPASPPKWWRCMIHADKYTVEEELARCEEAILEGDFDIFEYGNAWSFLKSLRKPSAISRSPAGQLWKRCWPARSHKAQLPKWLRQELCIWYLRAAPESWIRGDDAFGIAQLLMQKRAACFETPTLQMKLHA